MGKKFTIAKYTTSFVGGIGAGVIVQYAVVAVVPPLRFIPRVFITTGAIAVSSMVGMQASDYIEKTFDEVRSIFKGIPDVGPITLKVVPDDTPPAA